MFTFDNFVFVPANREIAIYSLEGHQADHKPLLTFYQVEVTNPAHIVTVGKTQLNFEAEYRLAEPTPDIMQVILNGITENIAPYLNKGVIGSDKTQGDITFRNDEGIWFMTRGMESITISNKHHIPDDDCDYWIAFTHGCTNCGDTPDFEFMGVDGSVLIIPEGVTLGEHLRPFVQTIQNEQRRVKREHSPLAGLLDSLPFANVMRDKIDQHVDEVGTVIAGVGEYYVGTRKEEVGGIRIDGQEVIAIYKDHMDVLGKRLEPEDDDNPYDVDDNLGRLVIRRVEKMMHIPLVDVNSETFSRQLMDKVTMIAMENDYAAIDVDNTVQRQLFHVIQSAAMPGRANWWLRVLVNAWFMQHRYPQNQVQGQVERQVAEVARHLDIDSADAVEIRFRLRDVVNGWSV